VRPSPGTKSSTDRILESRSGSRKKVLVITEQKQREYQLDGRRSVAPTRDATLEDRVLRAILGSTRPFCFTGLDLVRASYTRSLPHERVGLYKPSGAGRTTIPHARMGRRRMA
jgi:hypothetical protein